MAHTGPTAARVLTPYLYPPRDGVLRPTPPGFPIIGNTGRGYTGTTTLNRRRDAALESDKSMEIAAMVLLAFGLGMTALKLSLFERRRSVLAVAGATVLQPVLVVPWLSKLSWVEVMAWCGSAEGLEMLSVVLLAEAGAVLLLTRYVLRRHYGGGRATMGTVLALCPAAALLVPLNLVLLAALNAANGMNFTVPALAVSFVAGLLFLLGAIVARRRFRWVTRLELLALALCLQATLGAGLPLLLGGAPPPGRSYPPDLGALLALVLLCLPLIAAGYYLKPHGKTLK